MATGTKHERVLLAALCEIESGLFYATYRVSQSEADELPAYQVGACAEDAKHRLEQTIGAFGYTSVIWEDTLIVPPPKARTQERSRTAE
jgi:hypothetical protein